MAELQDPSELPVSIEVVRGLFAYAFADIEVYGDLTETERGLITENDFNLLRAWAMRRPAPG